MYDLYRCLSELCKATSGLRYFMLFFFCPSKEIISIISERPFEGFLYKVIPCSTERALKAYLPFSFRFLTELLSSHC